MPLDTIPETLWQLLAALSRDPTCAIAIRDLLLDHGEPDLADDCETLDPVNVLATFGCFPCQACELDGNQDDPTCTECKGVGYSREIAATEETDSYRVSMV